LLKKERVSIFERYKQVPKEVKGEEVMVMRGKENVEHNINNNNSNIINNNNNHDVNKRKSKTCLPSSSSVSSLPSSFPPPFLSQLSPNHNSCIFEIPSIFPPMLSNSPNNNLKNVVLKNKSTDDESGNGNNNNYNVNINDNNNNIVFSELYRNEIIHGCKSPSKNSNINNNNNNINNNNINNINSNNINNNNTNNKSNNIFSELHSKYRNEAIHGLKSPSKNNNKNNNNNILGLSWEDGFDELGETAYFFKKIDDALKLVDV
jgi:hypothetical protein